MFKKAVQRLLWKLAGAEEVSSYFERKWYEEQLAHARTKCAVVEEAMKRRSEWMPTDLLLEDAFGEAYGEVLRCMEQLDRRGW